VPSTDHSFVDVLAAEQLALLEVLVSLSEKGWSTPTPAAGWDITDQVSHLADTEEVAHDTVEGGPRNLAMESEGHRADGGLIAYGVKRGRALRSPAAVLEWWQTAADRNRTALRRADVGRRVPWGLGMKWRSFVTARLMEHWAHGLDIRAAIGVPYPDTERLEHIAHLCYGSLPYAFTVAGVTPPPNRTLRIELKGPSGQHWVFGPSDATDSITGPAGIWCRRAVQRITPKEAEALEVSGPLAAMGVSYARAFL
jgi:uncharacterized protein (TIGR03084 family)